MSWLIILTYIENIRKLLYIKLVFFSSVFLNMSTLIFCDLCFFISMNALKRYIMHYFEILVLAGWVSKG